MLSLFVALETSLPIAAIRTDPTLYALVNAIHVLSLATLIGAILTVDLRVIGLWKPAGWRQSLQIASPIAGVGLLLTIMTGVLLFAVRPAHYLDNGPFLVKLGLLFFGLANVAVFHLVLRRTTAPERPLILRLSAAASLLIWILAVFAGRFIAFVI